jgi:nucleoside-diphosphate-sugar epimerase
MRVVVVGATGNAGTAVLRALAAAPEVSSVLGIARRMPDTEVAPYSGCEWASIDIAAASSAEDAGARLRDAFTGADAVIHLAWLIQPNSQRELLRRVNVEGTERVARAAAAAGVRHLVAASSVGAYSPDPVQMRRDETWSTHGIPTSHYSVDKAAQERVLDEFSVARPGVLVTRLRSALIFQAAAGSEIQRYFLAGRVPLQVFGSAKPPVLPVPKGLRGMQAVHADDLGRAYAAAVVKRAPGAFNICADDVLTPQELADIIDHGRVVELPPRLVRAFLFGGHRAGLVAADEGWLDMATAVPMMDNSRAASELEWRPRVTAAQALRELLRGMAEGRGTASVPLRPRNPDDGRLPAARGPADSGADAGDPPQDGADPETARESAPAGDAGAPGSEDPVSADGISRDLLGLYLSDHLTGATAGAGRIERMAEETIDTPVYARLSELAEEIRLERAFLRQLIHDLGMRQRPYRQAVSWAGEHAGRLKSNGRLFSRSPLTLVLETELMRSAVMGKLGVWQTLQEHAGELGLDPRVFEDLAHRARAQAGVLDEVHEYVRRRAFREDRAFDEGRTASAPQPRDD